jgi:RNA polymerase sigma-70 factor, ECF subfamily
VTVDRRADAFKTCRSGLLGFATRLVLRPEIAEELVQQAAVRLLEQPTLPETDQALRAWLFRVVNHLAIDHLRRHGTWREEVLLDTRERAERDAGFIAESRLMTGSPELAQIAREHLAVCFSCTARALDPRWAAALLLKEVYEFTVEETADVMEASPGQVKSWVQTARASLEAKYASTCSLVTKQGACFQCVELDGFFAAGGGDPLEGSARDLYARLAVLRAQRDRPLGGWHRQMMRLVDEVVSGGR